jgi:amidase
MTTHHFTPTHYHVTLGPHEPVLHIADGDTVETTTVDAAGRDATGDRVTPGGNPQTGPFYVDGSEPGDTLALDLLRLAPNRPQGWSRDSLAANVVDPDYVRELPESNEINWLVDSAGGTATLVTALAGLSELKVPLAPMLGCFGVAPSRGQAISTATSGPHGGNMDYRGFVAGVTVYFPVLVPGALVHVGDGHAVQGDGEIVGTGIEISFDVTFRVRVLKGQRSYWPRAENQTHIFTVGNARPLDQALQHATTEMMRWLTSDYGLDGTAAGTLLGQTVEYDLGNVFDPAYTMVCKVAKRYLPSIG